MTCTYVIQSFHTLQNWCNRGGNTIFKYIMLSLLSQFGSAFSLLKKGCQYFRPCNECTSHWCLVMSFCAPGSHMRVSTACLWTLNRVRLWLELTVAGEALVVWAVLWGAEPSMEFPPIRYAPELLMIWPPDSPMARVPFPLPLLTIPWVLTWAELPCVSK